MSILLQRYADRPGGYRAIRHMIVAAAFFGLASSLAKGTALAGEERGENRPASCESRIYGTVEKTPPGNIGTWVINKRDVTVTGETRIIERYGKAATGAYVEVEGNNTVRSFTASKIEVKRSRQR